MPSKQEAMRAADQSKDDEEIVVDVKRMPTLTLGEYFGTKYDGSPEKSSEWDGTIRNKKQEEAERNEDVEKAYIELGKGK